MMPSATMHFGRIAWQCHDFRVWAGVEHHAEMAVIKRLPNEQAN